MCNTLLNRIRPAWRPAALAALAVLLLGLAPVPPALAGAGADIHAADQAKNRGDFTSAMQLYNRALRSGELDQKGKASVHFKRGTVFGIIGDRAAMLDDYAKAVALSPDSAYYRLNYGGVLMRQGRYPSAAEQFQAAARLEPESALPVSSLGVLYWEQGESAQAEGYLKKAAEMKPDSGWEREKLATFHLSLGRYQKALEWFQRAAKLEPDSAELPLLQFICASLADKPAPPSFARAAAAADAASWPGPAYLLYEGKLSPSKYLDWLDALGPDQKARLAAAGRYYLAYWRLTRGETDLAVKSFDWLVDNAPLASLSRTAALAELRRRGR